MIARFVDRKGGEVEAVRIVDDETAAAVRADEGWHDGQVRGLTYETSRPGRELLGIGSQEPFLGRAVPVVQHVLTSNPVLFVGMEVPLSWFGQQVLLGQYVVKHAGGHLEVLSAEVFESRFSAVPA